MSAEYQRTLERVIDGKGKGKVLWDFDLKTDEVLEHRRPEVEIFKRNKQECLVLDVAVPGDQHSTMKERLNVYKYGVLRTEIVKMLQLPVSNLKVMPIVIGALPLDLK